MWSGLANSSNIYIYIYIYIYIWIDRYRYIFKKIITSNVLLLVPSFQMPMLLSHSLDWEGEGSKFWLPPRRGEGNLKNIKNWWKYSAGAGLFKGWGGGGGWHFSHLIFSRFISFTFKNYFTFRNYQEEICEDFPLLQKFWKRTCWIAAKYWHIHKKFWHKLTIIGSAKPLNF